MRWTKPLLLLLIASLLAAARLAQTTPIRIGSKAFPESHLLAEIMAQLLEDRGFRVDRRFGLGGTIICYEGLVNREIDLYPEYSGTIEQAILKLGERVTYEELQRRLRERHGLELLPAFGFNNTYALTVRADLAARLGLRRISDLRAHPDLRFGLSQEFLEREDGWRPLAQTYGLTAIPLGMEHALAYQALAERKIDVMDVYTTDAEIQRYDLVLLKDDLDFFPDYLAAPLVRQDLDVQAKRALRELAGRLDETRMQRLNARVTIEGRSFAEAARAFLTEAGLLHRPEEALAQRQWETLAARTVTHLKLVLLSLVAAVLVAIPLGVAVHKSKRLAQPTIYVTGLLQTIPAIALLALLIAPFGIGVVPALIALFLYALLPILRNTYAALNSIDPVLRKVAVGMGLTAWQRLRYVELPLAAPNILAGIRTAAVISVGTATLAAFIGAGGLGQYIFTGVTLNDPVTIMWGAIPAALLAVLVELLFEAVERTLVPKHLQKQAQG